MAMRRGAGIAAFERHNNTLTSYAQLSSSLNQSSLDALQSQLSTFRQALQRFASLHRDEIRSNPQFRQQFQAMCANLGVDPLMGGRGGWWSELLGLGDWNHELGVQIVDICVGYRERNGGMMEMDELLRLLNGLRNTAAASSSSGKVTEDDVVRAIKTLKPLGAGYEVLSIGGRRMVRSVNRELDTDQGKVIEVAREAGGKVWVDLLMTLTGWAEERAAGVLERMGGEGLVWFDDQDEDCLLGVYWVMAVLQWE